MTKKIFDYVKKKTRFIDENENIFSKLYKAGLDLIK